jgi:hypothetical protein
LVILLLPVLSTARRRLFNYQWRSRTNIASSLLQETPAIKEAVPDRQRGINNNSNIRDCLNVRRRIKFDGEIALPREIAASLSVNWIEVLSRAFVNSYLGAQQRAYFKMCLRSTDKYEPVFLSALEPHCKDKG